MAKRPRFSDHSPRVSKGNYDQFNIDALLESLFAVSNSGFDASFDGLVKSRSTDSHQDDFIQRAIHVGSMILEAGKRSARKRSSVHNASVWPLPSELTINVFSMLDTPSLWSVAATCSFFQKCSIDPLCYTNIDLATLVPKIKPKIIVPKINARVSTMIKQAGNALQSIKLCAPPDSSYDEEARLGKMLPILTGSCLSSLSANGGAPGSRLRRLHLEYIEMKDAKTLSAAISASLSVCPSLVEIKMVHMNICISRILESVSRYCRLLENFTFEYAGGRPDLVEASVCKEFVLNCPKITTLVLQACRLFHSEAFKLVKGFHELKYVDFTGCYSLSTTFLRKLVTKGSRGNCLEVMILRRLRLLDKVAVKKFMKALIAGKFRHLRHLDISKNGELVYNYDATEVRYGVSFIDIPTEELLKQRPNFCLVLEYNESDSRSDTSSNSDSDTSSDSD